MAVSSIMKKYYPEIQLLGYTFIDGTVAFYNSINNLIASNANDLVLLDLGCGRGAFFDNPYNNSYIERIRNFKGRVKKVIGLDVDINACVNPSLDEFYLLELNEPWPLEDNSVNICISDWVIEHLDDTSFFFSELNRVMKKDGFACFRTANKYGYVALFSKLIPNYFHTKLLRKIQLIRKEEDVFPTLYKCNTKKRISHFFKENGFESFVYYHISEPGYLTFSNFFFFIGYYLHKILPGFLKTTILAFGKKS